MSKIIAIVGKGGTGKTTLTSLIIRALKEEGSGSILAIDADPNSNLGELLGASEESTIVGIIDDISKNPDMVPRGMTKDRFIDLKVQEALTEEEGFDLLSMGRPEGPGCYCFANNMLRDLIEKLMRSYEYIVIDNEAGMEHLSRRLVRKIDTLFVISDNSVIGIRSAARISKLADELNIEVKTRSLVVNKFKEGLSVPESEIEKSGLKSEIRMPFSEELEEAAIHGKSVFEVRDDNPVLATLKAIVEKKGEKYAGIERNVDREN